jgi:putative ABC transport system substrate-binding protein
MKKIIVVVGIVVLAALGLKMSAHLRKPLKPARYTIGILQTASHVSLDAAREGFVEELKKLMGDDVAFVFQNAQGSVSQAHSVAQQFHANIQIDAVFAIATPAVQAMSAVEKEKPLFIAATTYPEALGLVHPTTHVCGTNDKIDIAGEIEMFIQLVPAVKKVGILYTCGEQNSAMMAQQMRRQLEAKGLEVTDFTITSESDIQAIVEVACRKVDALLTPTDNMIGAAIPLVAGIAIKYKRPLIVSANMQVVGGALAARGVDYTQSGRRTAQIAYQVLVHGKKPYTLPIEQLKSKEMVINKTTLNTLGITVPEELQQDVVLVG